jgi:hypothetical protein
MGTHAAFIAEKNPANQNGQRGNRSQGKRTPEMPERGLEPPPSYLDKNLNLARLPIPPLGQVAAFATSEC